MSSISEGASARTQSVQNRDEDRGAIATPPNRSAPRRRWLRIGYRGWWTGLLVLAFAAEAQASHFRYAHNTWRRISGTTVEFTSVQAWRADGLDILCISPGDGSTCTTGPITDIGTFTDLNGDAYTIREYSFQHTYPGDGPFTAVSASCCRIGNLVNAGDASEQIETVVNLAAANQGSPVSSIPVVLQMIQGGLNSVPLPITDPDGDPISCRMATFAESQIPSVASAGANSLSVSPSCVLAWDTSATVAGQKYAVQVAIEETHAANTSKVALDFIIEIVDGTLNSAPECTGTSGTNLVNVGTPFVGNFTGTDSDGDDLTLSHLGLPPGATLSPPSGTTSTQPFASVFNWTPQPSDAGSARAVTIVYEDPAGLQDTCSFSLRVPLCGDGVIDPAAGEQCDPGAVPGACGSGETCTASCVCVPCGNGVVDPGEQCDDGNTDDGDCCSGSCQFEAAGSACAEDGDACTADVCGGSGDEGLCTHPPLAPLPPACQLCGNGTVDAGEQCDDGGTTDGDCCDSACRFEVGPCDDGDVCVVGESCQSGICTGGAPVDCSAVSNSCAPAACDPSGSEGNCSDVTTLADGSPCEDGDACTENSTCDAGTCLQGTPVSCDDANPCTSDACDPSSGCVNEVVVESRTCASCDDGTDNDGDANIDFEDEDCSTLAGMARFAVLAANTSSRRALRTGSDVGITPMGGVAEGLPFPTGPSVAGVCAGNLRLAQGTTMGLLATPGNSEFGQGGRLLDGIDLGGELATDGGSLKVRGYPPLVGPTVCSSGSAIACSSDADCSSGTCSKRLRITDSPNPWVNHLGTSDNFGRCLAAIADADDTFDAIAQYVPASGESVSLASACPSCAGGQQIRTNSRTREVVITVGSGLQVLDVDRVQLSGKTRLRIRGRDDTVLVVRVDRRVRLGGEAEILLEDDGTGAGALSADRLLWIVRRCAGRAVSLGRNSLFAGTVLAPQCRMTLGSDVDVEGALLGGTSDIRGLSTIHHVPFTPLLPVTP